MIGGGHVISMGYLVAFHKWGYPKWMAYFMENPMKIDDITKTKVYVRDMYWKYPLVN